MEEMNSEKVCVRMSCLDSNVFSIEWDRCLLERGIKNARRDGTLRDTEVNGSLNVFLALSLKQTFCVNKSYDYLETCREDICKLRVLLNTNQTLRIDERIFERRLAR